MHIKSVLLWLIIHSVNLKQLCIMETPRKKRKAFSVKDKLEALDRIKSGVTQTQVARDLGNKQVFFFLLFVEKNRRAGVPGQTQTRVCSLLS